MNKVTSTGLNLVNKTVKENVKENFQNQESLLNKRKELLKESRILEENSFINNVSNALDNVASTQKEAAQITKNYELGKEQDLTKVIVNQQISKLAFQMTLNIRNKVLSAYKDIMNMPV
ncbi:MAG: flagellar hook-basal body complex protein FliE [Rickettsiales bacterium]|nr:flagellar hook-basal body complex protein FliE [Rickettsiales bacterium]|tara:strand:+ start:169 stop:525 length:357 start_codon:yes stop_codon:yes gene_type:complete